MSTSHQSHLRRQLAEEAARIMAQEYIDDYKLAKQKALHRLGYSEHTPLPSNAEIHQALTLYQELFATEQQSSELKQLRQAALNAMQLCQDYNPHLVGAVLNGSAQHHYEIQIHLFNDDPESIAICLIGKNIPYRLGQQNYRYPYKGKYKEKAHKDKKSHSQHIEIPCYHFVAGDNKFALSVFSLAERHQAPLDPIDAKPMQRANIEHIKGLLADPN